MPWELKTQNWLGMVQNHVNTFYPIRVQHGLIHHGLINFIGRYHLRWKIIKITKSKSTVLLLLASHMFRKGQQQRSLEKKTTSMTSNDLKQAELLNRPEHLVQIFHDCCDVASEVPNLETKFNEIDYHGRLRDMCCESIIGTWENTSKIRNNFSKNWSSGYCPSKRVGELMQKA